LRRVGPAAGGLESVDGESFMARGATFS